MRVCLQWEWKSVFGKGHLRQTLVDEVHILNGSTGRSHHKIWNEVQMEECLQAVGFIECVGERLPERLTRAPGRSRIQIIHRVRAVNDKRGHIEERNHKEKECEEPLLIA